MTYLQHVHRRHVIACASWMKVSAYIASALAALSFLGFAWLYILSTTQPDQPAQEQAEGRELRVVQAASQPIREAQAGGAVSEPDHRRRVLAFVGVQACSLCMHWLEF